MAYLGGFIEVDGKLVPISTLTKEEWHKKQYEGYERAVKMLNGKLLPAK